MCSTKLGWLSVILFCATQHKTKISFRAQVGLLAPSWHCCRGRTFLLQPKYFSSDCSFISNALQVKRCALETDLPHFQVVDLCKQPWALGATRPWRRKEDTCVILLKGYLCGIHLIMWRRLINRKIMIMNVNTQVLGERAQRERNSYSFEFLLCIKTISERSIHGIALL